METAGARGLPGASPFCDSLWLQQLPGWLCPCCGWCWLWTLLPAREVLGVSRHQLALPWKRNCWGSGQFSLLLGKDRGRHPALDAWGCGVLATPLLLLLRLQVPREWEEASESTVWRLEVVYKKTDSWESGDLGWAWLRPTGVFPLESQFSYLC